VPLRRSTCHKCGKITLYKFINFESLINAFEALPEDVRSAEIITKGTPRSTLQNSEIFNFGLLRHIIIQMMILDETGIFDCGHSPLGLADDYRNYNSPLDKFIECDFSTFMASTASKWVLMLSFILLLHLLCFMPYGTSKPSIKRVVVGIGV
jgi:hypothetical protein